jgi:hypothetical protein
MIHGIRACRASRFAAVERAWLCAAVFVAFWPIEAVATYGQCVWEGGPGAPTYPECKMEDCVGSGGVAQCTEPEIQARDGIPAANVDGQKFTYGMCDYEGPYLGYAVRWCLVEGGTWTAAQTCPGLTPPFDTGGPNSEGLAISTSTAWENYNAPSCQRTIVSDSGWGFDDSGDQLCGGATTMQNGKVITDVRQLTYGPSNCGASGTTIIILTKYRQLGCPQSYYRRSLSNGNIQCYMPADCTDCTTDRRSNPGKSALIRSLLAARAQAKASRAEDGDCSNGGVRGANTPAPGCAQKEQSSAPPASTGVTAAAERLVALGVH